jgi:signal peptidase I
VVRTPGRKRFRRQSAEDDAAQTRGHSKHRMRKKQRPFWRELPLLIVVALALTFLIQTFIGRQYVIPSGSMEKTLHGCTGCEGDRIYVDKLVYDFSEPDPGEVVVFRGPDGWSGSGTEVSTSGNAFVQGFKNVVAAIGIGPPQDYELVKRVIAVGGQTISCCDAKDRMMVDGKPLNEPYAYREPGLPERPDQGLSKPVKVPQGSIFVMGDNRNNSNDSRFQNGGGVNGVVPVDNVIGKVRTIIWPPSRWDGVSDNNPQQ